MQGLVKRPIDPARIRRVPRQFGALDRNLIYRHHVRRLGPAAFALYALLVCVSDPLGLSYYSDRKLCELLGLEPELLARARYALVHFGLILYHPPFYQLLDLPEAPA
jgi:hypothetical protein